PVRYDQIPPLLRNAFLAAEDHRFFQESGISFLSIARAAMVDLIAGKKVQGGSTITMQAARNMFLTLDKTFRRKLQETFVTSEMDHEFTKKEIFQLYLNKIFFGQRSYGVAAAAQTYFGRGLDQLTVAEAATLAGIPQAPSLYNPIIHPHLAVARRTSMSTHPTWRSWCGNRWSSRTAPRPRPPATASTRPSTAGCRRWPT